jgi:hypothetical protein
MTDSPENPLIQLDADRDLDSGLLPNSWTDFRVV